MLQSDEIYSKKIKWLLYSGYFAEQYEQQSMSEPRNLKLLNEINFSFYLISSHMIGKRACILHNKMRVLDRVIANGIFGEKVLLFLNSMSW